MDVWSRGDAYERFMGRWSRRVAPLFLDWLDLPGGLRWADVGCGSGALTTAILDRARPTAVLGVDPAEAQVREAARQVVDERVRFEPGDATSLPEGAFDVVVSGLVLNFVPDPVAAAAAMGRAAASGVVAAYVWDYVSGMQMLRRFWDVATELDPDVAALHEGHRFPITGPEVLAGYWRDAGLADVAVTGLTVPTVFSDFDDFWSPFLGGVGPGPAYVVSLGDPERERLRAHLSDALTPDEDGRIRLTARAWAVRGAS